MGFKSSESWPTNFNTWRPKKQTLPIHAISYGEPIKKGVKVAGVADWTRQRMNDLIELCSTGNCLVSHWASQAQSGQPACCVPFSLPCLWQLSAVSFLLPIVASKHLLPLLHTRCIWKRVVCQLLASQERNRYQVIHLLSDTNPYSIVLLVASYPFMCLENCVITLTYTYTSMHIYV